MIINTEKATTLIVGVTEDNSEDLERHSEKLHTKQYVATYK